MSKNLHSFAAALGALTLAALPQVAQAHHHGHGVTQEVRTVTIVVSCFRGPLNDVIWDRPNAVFIDSLVEAGYSYPEAHAVAERVCRDHTTVGNNEAIRSTMLELYGRTPPGTNR